MTRPSVLGALVAVAAVLAGACSSGGKAPAPSTTTSAPPTTTTTAAPTTTTAPAYGTEPRPSPDAAAHRLIETWVAGDRGSAAHVATSSAPVVAIFARAYAPPAPSNRGCGSGEPTGGNEVYDCVYGYGRGLLRITVAGHARPGYLVTGAAFEGV